MTKSPSIIYTWTDEAPALATHAFLPIARAFAGAAGVPVETRDISLAARVLSQFPDLLGDRKIPDDLAELGELVELPEANVIKLPNISASVPQLQACIAELQGQGYPLPDYPEEPANDEERDIKAKFDTAVGSVVNPVLRQGNSDRRAPEAVKSFAKANPGRMRAWSADSKTHVSTMGANDFRSNEKSVTVGEATTAQIEHVAADGSVTTLVESLPLQAGEVVDGTLMSKNALTAFLAEQVAASKADGVLFSLHLKATMMRVSDPILFGHAVRAFYASVFEKHADVIDCLGVNPNNGIGDLISKIDSLDDVKRAEIEADLEAVYTDGPGIAMVNSDRGITNLHVPSDVIIDASIPPLVRDSGKMWNGDGELQDTNVVIPDSSYAGIYHAVIEDCKANGQFDPATMGTVPNVGLMAQAAQEYGSHNKTFEISNAGTVRIVDGAGTTLIEHEVEEGDIWRACQTKDLPIQDWVRLAVTRARLSETPAVFWLDKNRSHDAELIKKVETYLKDHDTNGLEIHVLSPVEAMAFSLEQIRKGEDTISVTGNVLRDYLTDLFPILELGTSARMLSIVSLLNGGGLFETGAGGSAPKHVEQFEEEGHLRWDSLGEYTALAASLEHLGNKFGNDGATVLGAALDKATAQYLDNGRLPSRKVNEIDNRGSAFYLTLYWAQALAEQTDNAELAAKFRDIAGKLSDAEDAITGELLAAQGSSQDVGGYYKPDGAKASEAMCPSETLNAIIAHI